MASLGVPGVTSTEHNQLTATINGTLGITKTQAQPAFADVDGYCEAGHSYNLNNWHGVVDEFRVTYGALGDPGTLPRTEEVAGKVYVDAALTLAAGVTLTLTNVSEVLMGDSVVIDAAYGTLAVDPMTHITTQFAETMTWGLEPSASEVLGAVRRATPVGGDGSGQGRDDKGRFTTATRATGGRLRAAQRKRAFSRRGRMGYRIGSGGTTPSRDGYANFAELGRRRRRIRP